MRMYFMFTSIGLIAATACGAFLAWDGTIYFFYLLDQQIFSTPNHRLINIPLQWSALFFSHFTSNIWILEILFGLPYVAIPLIALALSWWIVRHQHRSLFIWAALGVGFATLPGQFIFVSEANIALQLFWPVALAILTCMPIRTVPVVFLLILAIGFSHPDGIGLFTFASALAFAVGLRYPAERLKMWLWALGFGLVTGAFLLRFLLVRSSYEGDQFSVALLKWVFSVAVAGFPLLAMISAMFAALAVFAEPWLARSQKRGVLHTVYAFEFINILGAGCLLVSWAGIPRLWMFANKFTFAAPFTSLFLLSIAGIERLSRSPYAEGLWHWADDWPHRRRTAQMVSGVFALVLCVQSTTWFNLTHQLQQTLAQNSWSCISMAPIWWLTNSPFSQFGVPYYSLLLQGRTPQKVLLNGDSCGTATFTRGVYLGQNELRSWDGGWFNLHLLRERLIEERTIIRGCWFMLSSGWYQTETNDATNWWRWSDGRAARLQIVLDKDENLMLAGRIQSLQLPNAVDIIVNGARLTTLEITSHELKPFTPLALPFKRGENIMQFVSHNPPIDDTSRRIAIAVSDITLTIRSTGQLCDKHP